MVAVACLDPGSRKLVTDMDVLAEALDDPNLSTSAAVPTTDTAQLAAARWQRSIESPGFAARAGVPQVVAGAVRVYQRIFYLPWK